MFDYFATHKTIGMKLETQVSQNYSFKKRIKVILPKN